MGGRHGFKFRQNPGNCVHAGAGPYIDQNCLWGYLECWDLSQEQLLSKIDLTVNHQNHWQNRHKTDKTLRRIPHDKNNLQTNIVRSHHKRMCTATMLSLNNLCNIYEFDFIWSILKKTFEWYAQYSGRLQWYVCRIACNCSAEATNITWHCWFLSQILYFKNSYILCVLFLFPLYKTWKKKLSLLPALISHLYLSWGILDAKSSRC